MGGVFERQRATEANVSCEGLRQGGPLFVALAAGWEVG